MSKKPEHEIWGQQLKNYKFLVDRLYYLLGKEIAMKADVIDQMQREKDADIQASENPDNEPTGSD